MIKLVQVQDYRDLNKHVTDLLSALGEFVFYFTLTSFVHLLKCMFYSRLLDVILTMTSSLQEMS